MRKDLKNRVILFFLMGFYVLFQSLYYTYIRNEILFFLGIFIAIFIMVYGAFLLLRRHINVLRLIAAVFIVIMWITYFTQPLYSNTDQLFDYILIVLYSIIIILITFYTPKEWKKYEKEYIPKRKVKKIPRKDLKKQ